MIEVKGISVRSKSKFILSNLNFSIVKGKTLVALGANGAGKTTLFNVLSGYLKPDYGEITIFGKRVEEYKEKELASFRSMLTQLYSVSFPSTGRDIILLGRINSKLPDKKWLSAFEKIQQLLDINSIKDKDYHILSGGEKQRIHLARCIYQLLGEGDKILILDEPMAQQDIYFQNNFRKLLEMLKSLGFTVIVSIHDLSLALQTGDHFLLLNKGKTMGLFLSEKKVTEELLSEAFATRLSKRMISGNPVVMVDPQEYPPGEEG